MVNGKKIAFVGPGAMAEAMIAGLIRQQVAASDAIVCSGPSAARCDELAKRFGIRSSTDNAAAVKGAEVVVLSVKPQRLDSVLVELKGAIEPTALVVLIVAGATIDKISAGLDHTRIVRSMPNTPAQIGEGITVWTAAPAVSAEQTDNAREILTAFGDEVFVEEERFLDMATALSGTGPAYVFLFMEAMVDAGVHLGFSRRVAEVLVERRSAARWTSIRSRTTRSTSRDSATRSRRPGARRPLLSTISKRRAFAPLFRERCGQPTAVEGARSGFQRALAGGTASAAGLKTGSGSESIAAQPDGCPAVVIFGELVESVG